MQIYISDNAIIASIQRAFQAVYPYLKLEFYSHTGDAGAFAATVKKVSPDTPVDDIRDTGSCGWLDISQKRTAAALEADLKEMMGLTAQVKPRRGDLWLKTACTINWSLAQLNAATVRANHYLY
ncbi:hypothetical protein [uncultured Chitinophaga sp.]|jgi:hypothetical protein|uniref:hypothetical protein n=1 Tax=uncultured Chitinophaga sp. TaxID=339340 RepID=UPI0026355ACF|nr:hypothetical protein [uncultured Chitinophaga sp.]